MLTSAPFLIISLISCARSVSVIVCPLYGPSTRTWMAVKSCLVSSSFGSAPFYQWKYLLEKQTFFLENFTLSRNLIVS